MKDYKAATEKAKGRLNYSVKSFEGSEKMNRENLFVWDSRSHGKKLKKDTIVRKIPKNTASLTHKYICIFGTTLIHKWFM